MSEIIKSYDELSRSAKRYGIRLKVNTPPIALSLHRHNYFEFEIIKSGSISHELNGVPEILGAGDVVVLSPKDLHRFTVLEPVEIYNLGIYYKDAPSAVQKLLSSVKFPLRGTFSAAAMKKIIEYYTKIIEVIAKGVDFEYELITAYAILLLTDVFSVAKKETATCTSGGYIHISGAMEFIAANFTSHISLDDVAESVHLTPTYFSKLFAEISGKSFISYLTEQRLEHAKHLLATTDSSVTEVALASGFGSFSAFSRAFRKRYNMSPNEFRKNVHTM